MAEKNLNTDQANAVLGFMDAFEQRVTGVWSAIEEHMRENWGIEDPEQALEDVRQTLEQ